MTITRTIPKSLSGLLGELELEQPQIVTVSVITDAAKHLGLACNDGQIKRIAYRLQNMGWLGSLRTKGAWEFYPAARAGAYGSGDRFIEFRAQSSVCDSWQGALAMESASALLGLGRRTPSQEVLALPHGEKKPVALSEWRLVRSGFPEQAHTTVSGLRCWKPETLLAGIAVHPDGYRDLPGLAQWLPEVKGGLDERLIRICLDAARDSSWQRMAYLLRCAGETALAQRLLSQRPPKHMIWFGATRTAGKLDKGSMVNDADLAPYLERSA
jgi:hypothetical protein